MADLIEGQIERARNVIDECGMGLTSEQYIASLRLSLLQMLAALAEQAQEIEQLDARVLAEKAQATWAAAREIAAEEGAWTVVGRIDARAAAQDASNIPTVFPTGSIGTSSAQGDQHGT